MIRYCKACKHAEFAHNGLAHDEPVVVARKQETADLVAGMFANMPRGCDLCVCKKFEHD